MKRIVYALACTALLVTLACDSTPTEPPPCNDPDDPNCHQQGVGTGGQSAEIGTPILENEWMGPAAPEKSVGVVR